MGESVELATIYLVDLVGSTRLETSVGPARADQLRDEFFAVLREAIESCGGREFKNTGDGLVAVFRSASAGVRCAVLTQQLFERRYRNREQRLHVRIGLGTGEATVSDGDYFGMPAVEAARLCDKAPVDGILVSPATRMLAGRVEGARFESVGELELKGISEPMEAFSVLWEALDPEQAAGDVGRWPLPEALRVVPRMAYVGRSSERDVLERALGLARSGARQVVLLSGEPGIGKTRLASYSALGANADGFAVVWGGCSDDLAVPYEPWIAICEQLVEHAPQAVLEGSAERYGGEVGRLARDFRRRVPDARAPQSSDPETERFVVFQAVAELLRAVAGAVPLLVVLDDFHWADAQSVALFKHVARSVERAALAVLVTYRDTDLGKDDPLTGVSADLRRLEGVERVGLGGLAVEDVEAMAAATVGHDLDAEGVALAGEIAAETGGNPFFVGEILQNLAESGMVVFDEERGRWMIDRGSGVALPESVRDVVERRVAMLSLGTRETLTAAAVIGRSFDLELLARLVEVGEGELLDRLEAAVAASLLVESADRVGRFSFAHALINHTLYEGLGATRRARLHLRIAEALEGLYGTGSEEPLAELALHWRLASVSVDPAKAARYSLRAAQRALASLAPSEAAKLFGDALELLATGASAERCQALIGLGEAQQQTGVPAYRETLLEASRIASELGDADLAARAALANSRGIVSRMGGVDAERVAAIERALELDIPPQPARRARLLSLLARELINSNSPDHAQRWALANAAIALAREAGDPRTLAWVLLDAWYACWLPDTLATRADQIRELNGLLAEVQDLNLEFFAKLWEVWIAVELCEFARADAALERMQAIAEETRHPTHRWLAGVRAAALTCLRGDLDAGEKLADQALQIGLETGETDAVMLHRGSVVENRLFQGRGVEVIAQTEQVVANYPLPIWEAALSRLYCFSDRRPEAAEILAPAAARRFENVPYNRARMTALAMYAETAAQTGSVEAATILYDLLEPYADQFIHSVASYGHTRLFLALLAATLGRHEDADAHFAFACDFHHEHRMRLFEARSELGWAEALAGRGETGHAREHAARALELAREHGYDVFEPRAAAILASHATIEG